MTISRTEIVTEPLTTDCRQRMKSGAHEDAHGLRTSDSVVARKTRAEMGRARVESCASLGPER